MTWETKAELLKHLRRPARFEPKRKLVQTQSIGNTHWMLVRDESGCVSIEVDMLINRKDSEGGRSWQYANQSETDGPHYFNCPALFLDMASPVDPDSRAGQWRARVRQDLLVAQEILHLDPAPDMVLPYGDYEYQLLSALSRRRWHVQRISDGKCFNMRAVQVLDGLKNLARARLEARGVLPAAA